MVKYTLTQDHICVRILPIIALTDYALVKISTYFLFLNCKTGPSFPTVTGYPLSWNSVLHGHSSGQLSHGSG